MGKTRYAHDRQGPRRQKGDDISACDCCGHGDALGWTRGMRLRQPEAGAGRAWLSKDVSPSPLLRRSESRSPRLSRSSCPDEDRMTARSECLGALDRWRSGTLREPWTAPARDSTCPYLLAPQLLHELLHLGRTLLLTLPTQSGGLATRNTALGNDLPVHVICLVCRPSEGVPCSWRSSHWRRDARPWPACGLASTNEALRFIRGTLELLDKPRLLRREGVLLLLPLGCEFLLPLLKGAFLRGAQAEGS
mmetsp:Transcript_21597/g.59360  ORF Transcript_21597/g.59360 Transcript_21597/m.59360 type:complete len:249 (-) Transcript_21597:70-816(-)